jgi:hemoglobin
MDDIRSEADITLLVDTFYSRVLQNEILAPFFANLDFEAHKPKMIFFWSFVLLEKTGYTTNVFDKHIHMPLKREHFNEWVHLFHQTVDDLFVGEKANDAKFRATTLGWTFGEKMEKLHQG